MRHRYLLLFIAATIMFSCKKEKQITDPLPSPPTPPPTVLVKDIVIARLPSPYYHFEYNAAGKVTFVSFASDFARYDVVYDGNRIREMRNNILVNKDTLRYSYDNAGRVDAIKYINEAGTVYTVLFFTYDGQKLIEIERDRKSGSTGYIIDRIMTMSYHPDGNLNELTYHYLPFNGQPEQVYTDRFEQYDNKINVDGFGLLHNEFFDHLILLPVQLQKNNPGKETRTGNGDNYKVDYTYTYDNSNAPLTRSGDFVYTSGP